MGIFHQTASRGRGRDTRQRRVLVVACLTLVGTAAGAGRGPAHRHPHRDVAEPRGGVHLDDRRLGRPSSPGPRGGPPPGRAGRHLPQLLRGVRLGPERRRLDGAGQRRRRRADGSDLCPLPPRAAVGSRQRARPRRAARLGRARRRAGGPGGRLPPRRDRRPRSAAAVVGDPQHRLRLRRGRDVRDLLLRGAATVRAAAGTPLGRGAAGAARRGLPVGDLPRPRAAADLVPAAARDRGRQHAHPARRGGLCAERRRRAARWPPSTRSTSSATRASCPAR